MTLNACKGVALNWVERATRSSWSVKCTRVFRRLRGRGTTLVSIEAVADSPQEAADRANAAVAMMRAALTQQQPAAVEVVEQAQPIFRSLPSERSVRSSEKVEDYHYGRWAWIMDPEGNRIELWEPKGK